MFPFLSSWRNELYATTFKKKVLLPSQLQCDWNSSFLKHGKVSCIPVNCDLYQISCTCLTSVSESINNVYSSLFQGEAHHLGLWMMCTRPPHTPCRLDFECNLRLTLILAIFPEVSSHCGDRHKAAPPRPVLPKMSCCPNQIFFNKPGMTERRDWPSAQQTLWILSVTHCVWCCSCLSELSNKSWCHNMDRKTFKPLGQNLLPLTNSALPNDWLTWWMTLHKWSM